MLFAIPHFPFFDPFRDRVSARSFVFGLLGDLKYQYHSIGEAMETYFFVRLKSETEIENEKEEKGEGEQEEKGNRERI